MSAAEDPLLWFVATDNLGVDWRVYLASEEGTDELPDGHWGRTVVCEPGDRVVCGRREIFINARLSEENQNMVLLHELMHAAASSMGPPMRVSTEEKLVRGIELGLWKFVKTYGRIKWPRKSRGYAALVRKARKLK